MYASYINNVFCVSCDNFVFQLHIKYALNYLIWMEMLLEGDISHMMATLLKFLPLDFDQHFCTYYYNYVNLIQDFNTIISTIKNNNQ